MAMVSIGCRLEIFSDRAFDSYDVDLTIMKGRGKNKKYLFRYETRCEDRERAAKRVSEIMYNFSYVFCENILDKRIDLTVLGEIEEALSVEKGKGKFIF